MFKAEYIVYLRMYISISCVCKNKPTNHLNFGQQLLRLALRINPW